MKKNKIYIIVLILILLLTGCKKQYTLTVKNDEIIEDINIEILDDEDNNRILNSDYYPLHSNEDIVYNKTIIKKNNILDAHFYYTYKPYDFVNANSINNCFDKREIIVDNDEYYYFKLSNLKKCMSNSNLDINIITDNKVLMSNADKVKGNKYIWHLREKNKNSFELEIKISKKEKKEKNIIIPLSISIIIVFIIITIIHFFSKKNRINNI